MVQTSQKHGKAPRSCAGLFHESRGKCAVCSCLYSHTSPSVFFLHALMVMLAGNDANAAVCIPELIHDVDVGPGHTGEILVSGQQ